MKTCIVVAVAALLSGCAMTVKDFRDDNPAFMLAQVPGQHVSMASCLMHRIEENKYTTPDMFRITTEQNHTSLLISRVQPSGPFTLLLSPFAEVIFTETQPKQVLVEARHRSIIGAEGYIDAAKPYIGTCAQQSLS